MRFLRLLPPYPVVVVLEPPSQGAVALAKLRLDSAGIQYMIRHDYVADYFGWGRLSGGINYVTGPVRISVNPEDAEAAREILGDLTEVRICRTSLALRLVAIVFLIVGPVSAVIEALRS